MSAPTSAPSGFRFRVNRAFKAMDDGERRKWILVVSARDLPPNLPLDANARVPNVVTNDTCIEMRETLLREPELFQILNSGMVCTANSVEIKQEGDQHIAYVSFNHDAEQGVVNGGHTYACLLHVLQDNPQYAEGKSLRAILLRDAKNPSPLLESLIADDAKLAERIAIARDKAQVQVEVVAPIASSELLAAVARARNLSKSVEATALANLAGKFEIMKHVLRSAGPPFGEALVSRVVWKTNQEVADDGPEISVKLLIQILALMNIRDYTPGTRVSSGVYARSGVIVREFSEADGDRQKFYDSLTQLLPEFLQLYDAIYESLPQLDPQYPWADGKIGTDKRARMARTPFLARPAGSKVANAFIWPVFSAFRLLLEERADGQIVFTDDPFALLDEKKSEFVGLLQNFHKGPANGMIQMVGKNSEIWVRMESSIREELAVRRRLGQPPRPLAPRASAAIHSERTDGDTTFPQHIGFVSDPVFVSARNPTERYLAVLSWCYRKHETKFPLICEGIRGHHRIYFSRDVNEIESSGTATAARQIPGTPYWASTNHSTEDKKEKLTDVLVRVLGYDGEEVRRSLSMMDS